MSQQTPTQDPKSKDYQEKMTRRDHRVERIFRRILYLMERIIAVTAIAAMVAALGLEIYRMCTVSGYVADVDHILHSLLTIVVGLEFVRMLIDTTPASILEVLTVAITRHVILSHDDYWSNVACIACIAGLFAIRRFLVRPGELREEMVEQE